MTETKKDFFISRNGKDKDWAEWIAWQLEAAGYSVVIQDWDFRPGSNFVLEMQKAAQADRTLIVLSPNYLAAEFTQPEWAAAFVQDPTGAKGTLLPVQVAECERQRLLEGIIHIDLLGLEEADARETLLAGVPRDRAKPLVSPHFPPRQGQPERQPPPFPEPLLLVRKKIRNQIRALLKQSRAQAWRDELVQQAGAESIEEVLVPQQPVSPLQALDLVHQTAKVCLGKLAGQPPAMVDSARDIVRDVFGWLVLLAVNPDQLNVSSWKFDPWQGGIEVRIPLESEAGTEVLISFLGDRPAQFKLIFDNKNRPSVVGQGRFSLGGLEMGIGQTDPLTELLKAIWVEVMKGEAPIPFGLIEINKLKAILKTRERRKESHYYITVPPEHDVSPLSDQTLLRNLLEALPSLRVIYIGSGQGGEILLLDEYELWASIQELLLMLRDNP